MISAVHAPTHAYLSTAAFAKTWKMFSKDLHKDVFPQSVGPVTNMLQYLPFSLIKKSFTAAATLLLVETSSPNCSYFCNCFYCSALQHNSCLNGYIALNLLL